ncbi:MAG: superoxide dismutase [Ni] [Desulfobacterales bacterium]|nr:superoxide dismutase [Ni] [Desulfobacterales bacterium]
MKHAVIFTVALALAVILAPPAQAHCEIPCGIYDDRARAALIAEHIGTIEKSTKQILELQKSDRVNYNQLVRWVMNKETHATEIQTIVTQYFMTQRIKPDDAQYDRKIAVLHQMLIAAMKCKQTTDLKYVAELRELLQTFDTLYFK